MTQAKIKSALDYNPTTGIFQWKLARPSRPVGSIAGTLSSSGYWIISVFARRYQAHRLAFIWMTGKCPKEIDHINCNKIDNRWKNLRSSSRSQNQANMAKRVKDKILPKGIRYHSYGQYEARIGINYRNIYLGLFDTPEQAHAAYVAAAKQYFGQYART